MLQPSLVTARLALTPFLLDDAAALFEIRSDPEAMLYWDWPCDTSPAETLAIAAAMLEESNQGEASHWTIRRRADQRFVGVCDLSALDGSGSAEIGFMLARRCWGFGYAAEAVGGLLDQARQSGLRRLSARIHVGNRRSDILLRRQGFVLTAGPADQAIRPGVRVPCCWYERRL